MRSIEHDIATTIANFLTARGDKIACDRGTLILHDDGGRTVAEIDGATFDVEITVRRRTP